MDVALVVLGAAAASWGLVTSIVSWVRSERRRREGVTVVTQPTYRAQGAGQPLELVRVDVTITNGGQRPVELIYLMLGDPGLSAMLHVQAGVAPELPLSLQPDVPLRFTLTERHVGPSRMPGTPLASDVLAVVAKTRQGAQPMRSASSPRIPLRLST